MTDKRKIFISFLCVSSILLLVWRALWASFIDNSLEKTLFKNATNVTNVIINRISNREYITFSKEIQERYINNKNITKIIHQSWKNRKIPKVFKRYVSSWKVCFPHWDYKYWTDEDNRNLIIEKYSWFLAKYDSFPKSIYKADCARYFYMHQFGGLYTDMDNECLLPFEHLLANYSFVFGTIDHVPRVTRLVENYVQNSFMYSRPNQTFWLEIVMDIFNSDIIKTADIVTGPIVLSNMIHKYRTRYKDSQELRVYDARYFNPITWGDQWRNPAFCKIWDGMSEDEYEKCHNFYVKKGSYVVQYHTHVWG